MTKFTTSSNCAQSKDAMIPLTSSLPQPEAKQKQLYAELMLKHADLVKRNEQLKRQLTQVKDQLNLASEMLSQACYLFDAAQSDLEKNGTAETCKAMAMIDLGLRESQYWADFMSDAAEQEAQNV